MGVMPGSNWSIGLARIRCSVDAVVAPARIG
jgi:hypothetical protein